jgi:hypothetical protein
MLDQLLQQIHPPLSFVIFGGLGGFLYILRQKMRKHPVSPWEYLGRPVLGAFAAYVLTVALGLPNHLTSSLAGYFGIDVFDTVVNRFEPLSKHLPFVRHEARPPVPPPVKPDEQDPNLPL